AEGGFRPMLFDLEQDPQELTDLGACPDHAPVIEMMYRRLAKWSRRPSQRTTISDTEIAAGRSGPYGTGVFIGVWDEAELPPDVRSFVTGPAPARKPEGTNE
ncbi:MAG: phosphonate monoester hydrolase, partial [Pseudomonadota bacterium]